MAQFSEKPTLLDCGHRSDVRPLAIGITGEIAAVMGWSHPYTLGVLAGWKMAAVYCQAVLCYDQRVALDGAPAEVVDAKAKDLAAKQLAKLAARKTAKNVAKLVAPAAVKPAPAPTPPPETTPETPEQLRARVRAASAGAHRRSVLRERIEPSRRP